MLTLVRFHYLDGPYLADPLNNKLVVHEGEVIVPVSCPDISEFTVAYTGFKGAVDEKPTNQVWKHEPTGIFYSLSQKNTLPVSYFQVKNRTELYYSTNMPLTNYTAQLIDAHVDGYLGEEMPNASHHDVLNEIYTQLQDVVLVNDHLLYKVLKPQLVLAPTGNMKTDWELSIKAPRYFRAYLVNCTAFGYDQPEKLNQWLKDHQDAELIIEDEQASLSPDYPMLSAGNSPFLTASMRL